MTETLQRWIPVTEQLPTHIHTVVIWVVEGTGGPYMDVGSYFPEAKEWRASCRMEDGSMDDRPVFVTHWMSPEAPKQTRPLSEMLTEDSAFHCPKCGHAMRHYRRRGLKCTFCD